MHPLIGIPWNERQEVQVGNLGEETLDEFLHSRGYRSMRPNANGSHSIDRIYFPAPGSPIGLAHGIHWADAKTYARRTHYPDTGINLDHFIEYDRISGELGMPGIIYWVDPYEELIYGNWLEELKQPRMIQADNGRHYHYPLTQTTKTGAKIFFPIVHMRIFARLQTKRAELLRSKANRSCEYPHTPMLWLFDDPRDPQI